MDDQAEGLQKQIDRLAVEVKALRTAALQGSDWKLPLSDAAVVLAYARTGDDLTGRQNLRRRIGEHYRPDIEVFDHRKEGAQRPRWFFDVNACRERDLFLRRARGGGL